MQIELRLLEYFLVLADELHFTRAAERLGISQPTLSSQIQLLEARLNTRLFERTGRRVSLTQAGKLLLEHARRVFYELEQATAEIGDLQGLQRGSLSVGCAGGHLLLKAAAKFHARHPKVQLSIFDMRSEETIDLLLNHRLDLGVIFLSAEDPRLDSIHLFDEEFCLVVSAGHKLAGVPSASLEDLTAIPLVLLPKHYLVRQFIDEYTAAHGVELFPIMELSTMEAIRFILSIQTLAAIMTKSYVTQIQDPSLVVIPLIDVPHRAVRLVYPKHTYLDQIRTKFIQYVLEIYKPLTA